MHAHAYFLNPVLVLLQGLLDLCQVTFLGQGAWGQVWRATLAMDVAIKVPSKATSESQRMLDSEAATMLLLQHGSILRPSAIWMWAGRRAMVVPFCEKGSLKQLFR